MKTASEETPQAGSSARETGGRYLLTRSFILRTTGFPIELVQSLASPGLAAASDEASAAQNEAESRGLLNTPLNLSRSARRKLKRGLPLGEDEAASGEEARQLSRLLERAAAFRDQAAEIYRQELERTRKILYEFVVSEPFQHVLLLSSPDLSRFTPAEPEPPAARNSHVRQREFTWLSYLQRLTTKNETISFFGPSAWGEFDEREASAARIELSEQRLSGRVVYVERWVCEALAGLMSADPEVRAMLPLRLADDLFVRGEQAMLAASGKSFILSEEERTFLQSCAASPQCAADSPLAESLLERKLLTCDVQLPPDPLPFRSLRKEVADWPEHTARARWQASLEEIEQCREAIERAVNLDERRTGINEMTTTLTKLGLSHTQGSQALYTSRLPVNEDCRIGTRELKLGAPVMEQLLVDAAPWYEFWRDLAGLYATRLHQALLESWRAMGGKPVPLPAFWPAIVKGWRRLPEVEEEVQQAWQKQLGDRCRLPSVSLTDEDTAFLRNSFDLRRMKAFDNMSPDLQIVSADKQALSEGRWSLLIAEIHPDFTPWQHCFFVWCPDPEGFARDYAHQDGQGAAAVISNFPPYFSSAHTSLWVYPLAHKWGFVGARGAGGAQGVRSADTIVTVTDDDVLLMDMRGRPLGSFLHTWQTALNTHRLDLHGNAGHSPRLLVGRVIVQRESWRVEPDAALKEAAKKGGYVAFAALRQFRERQGLPERVFVRGCLPQRLTLDKDIKPIFVDFRSPLLTEMLGKMIGRFDKLLVTEMLPGAEDCWLEAAGGHYSSEFRTVVMASKNSRQAGRRDN